MLVLVLVRLLLPLLLLLLLLLLILLHLGARIFFYQHTLIHSSFRLTTSPSLSLRRRLSYENADSFRPLDQTALRLEF